MQVFVTGGSGFVGRHLVQALVARGDRVLALARSEASAQVLRALGAEAVDGDLDDIDVLARGMRGSAVVFHLAATVAQWGDPAEFQRVNVGGTNRVCTAARKAGVPKLVHVSTEAVLAGGGPIVQADETRPRAANPVGLYPRTKAGAEAAALAANREGLKVVVCRPRFIWGKGDAVLLPALTGLMRAGKWAWIGGGRYATSTCHVRNVVEGLLLAAERGRAGEIYFLTDGPPVEFRDFVTRMVATQGVVPGDREVPRALAYAVGALSEFAWRLLPLKGEPPLTRTAVLLTGEEVTVNDAKARRELGYVGRVSREDGLAEMGQP